MVKVAILDYGAGNIFSLKKSLEKKDAQVEIITKLDNTNSYSGLLLPGVGNFDPAIKSIRDYSKKIMFPMNPNSIYLMRERKKTHPPLYKNL